MLRVSAPLDVERIRADFPILQRQVNGRRLIYLDNAATTQKPQQVIDALVDFYTNTNANVHRGVHTLSVEATDAYESARERIARFVGAEYPEEIVFVRNTTEALNLVAVSWGRANLKPGDEILATRVSPQIRRQIVAIKQCRIAEYHLLGFFLREPGVLAERQVPQMMMGVDHFRSTFWKPAGIAGDPSVLRGVV